MTAIVPIQQGGAVVAPPRILRPIAKPSELLAAQNETRAAVKELLVPERDFGVIPGVRKPSLFQPGAERINLAFGVVARFRLVEKEVDHSYENHWEKKGRGGQSYRGVAFGLYRYVVECELALRDTNEIIGAALASCSTLESKYCDRPRDSENTVMQMAEKRAFVRATRTAYGLSDEFTQDVEDQPREAVEEERTAAPPKPAAPATPMTLEEARNFPFPYEKAKADAGKPNNYQKRLGALPLSLLQRAAEWAVANDRKEKDADFLIAVGLLLAEAEAAQTKLPLDLPPDSQDSSAAPAAVAPSSAPTPPAPATPPAATTEPGVAPLASTMAPAVPHTGAADPTSRHAVTQDLKRLCDDVRLPFSLREASRAVLMNPKATLQQLTRRRDELLAKLPSTDEGEINNEDDDLPF